MAPRLTTISRYPVKSMGGQELERTVVTPLGIQGDRRWVLTDTAGRFITQRTHPSLAQVLVLGDALEMKLEAPGLEPVTVLADEGAPPREITIWRDTVVAAAGPASASAWFSKYLGQPCLLSFMADDCRRPVDLPVNSGQHQVSFADGYPVLVISAASLDLLNSKLDEPVPMNRFRTNLVVAGCEAHEEDTWKRFRIGEAIFRAIKPCSRCSVPTIDQKTGQASANQEPLRTLATYRTQPGGVMFGVNLVVEQPGIITQGDELEILS